MEYATLEALVAIDTALLIWLVLTNLIWHFRYL
jgi:hypothetical protein